MTLTEFLLARIAEDEAFSVLTEKVAKRSIVALHSRNEVLYDAGVIIECIEGCIGVWPCATLRLLALPYYDHPDYLPEWKP